MNGEITSRTIRVIETGLRKVFSDFGAKLSPWTTHIGYGDMCEFLDSKVIQEQMVNSELEDAYYLDLAGFEWFSFWHERGVHYNIWVNIEEDPIKARIWRLVGECYWDFEGDEKQLNIVRNLKPFQPAEYITITVQIPPEGEVVKDGK